MGGSGGSRRSHLGDLLADQKASVSLKVAPKQTLCSLPTLDMLHIASNSMLKTTCTVFSTSVAGTRKW